MTWVRFLEGQSYGNVLRPNGPSVSQERERYSDESRVAEGSGAAPKPTHGAHRSIRDREGLS